MTTAAKTTVDQTNCINLEVRCYFEGVSLGVTPKDGEEGAHVEFDKITADGLAYILSHPPKANAEREVAYGPVTIMFGAGAETKATVTFERAISE